MTAITEAQAAQQAAQKALHDSTYWARSKGTGNHLDMCDRHLTAAIVALTPAPTPTPTGKWAKGGYGLMKLGQAIPADCSKFDLVDVGIWQVAAVEKLTATKRLVYMSIMSCDNRDPVTTGYWYGMSATELLANKWQVLDTSGNPIMSVSYPHSMLADVGIKAYQDKLAANVIGYLQTHHVDGCQFDDVIAQLRGYAWTAEQQTAVEQLGIESAQGGLHVPLHMRAHLPLGATTPKYPTDASWEAAMVACVNNVGAQVKAAGFYTMPNVYKAGGQTAEFMVSMKAGSNAPTFEDCFNVPGMDQTAIKTVLDAGLDAVALVYTPTAANEALMRAVDNGRAIWMTTG